MDTKDLPKSIAIKDPVSLQKNVIRTLKNLAKKYDGGKNRATLLVRMISQWPEIVGTEFIHTVPEKITYGGANRYSGNLHIRTYEKDKTLLSSHVDEVKKRVNLYFGRNIINKVIISKNFLDDGALRAKAKRLASIKNKSLKT